MITLKRSCKRKGDCTNVFAWQKEPNQMLDTFANFGDSANVHTHLRACLAHVTLSNTRLAVHTSLLVAQSIWGELYSRNC